MGDDIVVLHSSDSTDCSKYILDYLARDEYHLRTSSLLDSSFELDRTATKIKVLILILSAGHLDFLRNCSARSSYEEQIRNAGTTLVYLYGVGENDEVDDYDGVPGKSLRNVIPDYGRFEKFSFEQHQDLLKTTMIKVEGLDAPEPIVVVVGQGARAAEKKTGGGGGGGGVAAGRKGLWKRSTTQQQQQRRSFRVIPKTARCEASTAMIISLCDPTEEGRGREEEGVREEEKRKGRTKAEEEDTRKDVVTVAFGSNNPEQQIVLPTERINRNTFLFFAPERSEGVVPIHIVVNGDVIGQSSVVYQSLQSDLVLAVSQVYIFLLNRLLAFIHESHQLTPEVDRRLCGLLEDEEANAIPIQAFEQLFSLSAAFKGRSDFELPTLLHLAAKFGLVNFASKLKDLPDSGLAFELRNNLGHTPQELTRLRGQAPIARNSQLQKHPMLSTTRVDVEDDDDDDDDDGAYEKFCPMEDHLYSSSSTTHKEEEEEEEKDPTNGKALQEEDPYMIIPSDSNEGEERRSVVHPAFPDPPIFKTMGGGVAQQPPSLVTSKQAELVSIQRQVKSNELTINEAEVLFKEWQLRNSSTSDLDISRASMLSHTVPRPIPKPIKTKSSIVERLFKKTKTPPKQSKTTHLLSPTSPSIPEEQYPLPPPSSPSSSHHSTTTSTYDIYSPSSPRNSIASSSSRDSCISKGSTSGIETVDEEDDENGSNVYETAVTTFTTHRKSSANLDQLEEDLRRPNAPRPPPPPPRKTPIKTSTVVVDDVDKVEYLSMDGTCKRPPPPPPSSGQRRQGPPVGPRTRKMSCPTVEPHCAPVNRQFSLGQTNVDDSPADGDTKSSSGDACRPSSLAVEQVRTAPVPARKMSLPNKIPDNSNRVRPLPPVKK